MRTHKIISATILVLLLATILSVGRIAAVTPSATSSPAVTCTQTNLDGSTSQVDCSKVTDQAAGSGKCATVSNCDLVSKYINPLIAFLGVLVGLVVVASIIGGAIQYSSSGGNPQAASAAKKRIQNAIIALVAYIFMVAVLNFIVPGGLL